MIRLDRIRWPGAAPGRRRTAAVTGSRLASRVIAIANTPSLKASNRFLVTVPTVLAAPATCHETSQRVQVCGSASTSEGRPGLGSVHARDREQPGEDLEEQEDQGELEGLPDPA